jgi:hypothetical protein
MMSLGLRPRLIGHPIPSRSTLGVRICRRIDIARHWIATHPHSSSR